MNIKTLTTFLDECRGAALDLDHIRINPMRPYAVRFSIPSEQAARLIDVCLDLRAPYERLRFQPPGEKPKPGLRWDYLVDLSQYNPPPLVA